jgi:hypothetical protein
MVMLQDTDIYFESDDFETSTYAASQPTYRRKVALTGTGDLCGARDR